MIRILVVDKRWMFVRSFGGIVSVSLLCLLSVEESFDHVGQQHGGLGKILWT
jgi:hypothetical protein